MTSPDPVQQTGKLRYGFAIVGTQKSGTTTLSSLLDEHKFVSRAPRKELHFFDDERRDWSARDFSDHVARRRAKRHVLVGDATPTYLWWPNALERMHDYNPDTRLLAIFRDPIERLFSQWVMNASRWPRSAKDWPVFITSERPDGLVREVPTGVHTGGYKLRSGVVRGFYAAQLEHGFEVFDRSQWHLLEFASFLSDYQRHLDEITDFLGLPRYDRYPDLPHSMRNKDKVRGTRPTAEDVAGLVDLYREDLARFEEITGFDLRHWPTWQVARGELDPADLAAKLALKVSGP